MAVLLAVVSAAHAADAPAPSPTSPASVISPSFAAGFLAAAVGPTTTVPNKLNGSAQSNVPQSVFDTTWESGSKHGNLTHSLGPTCKDFP
ncbi:unnamed protein product [Sphenostylis stenocarpa]|uniref:Uncharacterized protein n=1 Tax=Sphenostylis stenocarpa TaxID=92480 RepID=A0AA86SVA4_9FABA|nr:unnamed protein product [Sphenostylis stenocarpa]